MIELGWKVTLSYLSPCEVHQFDHEEIKNEQVLLKTGVYKIVRGTQRFIDLLDQSTHFFDVAFLSVYDVAQFSIPIIRCKMPKSKIIFDMVDFHGIRLQREAVVTNNNVLLENAHLVSKLEVDIAKSSDMTIAITEDERSLMLNMAGAVNLAVVPLAYDIPEFAFCNPKGRSGLLFVGNFLHRPNSDGIIWFIETMWSRILSEVPDIELNIVGTHMVPEVSVFDGIFNINVHGFVEDLEPLMRQARITIAPLRYGAGMKGKVAHSMCFGLPVVTTGIGAEGMNLENGRHVLIADDPDTFSEHVIRLNHDDILWDRLSRGGYEHVNKTISSGVVKCLLDEVLKRVCLSA